MARGSIHDSQENSGCIVRRSVRDRILGNHAFRPRYEIKYLISESKAAAIAQFIKPYLPLDRYCKSQQSDAYPIVTLYLDSHNLQLCRQSLRGHKNRFKLRIRSYTDDPDYPRFFEIKRRMNAIIIKDRTRVMPRSVAPLISGLSLPAQNINGGGETLKQLTLTNKSCLVTRRRFFAFAAQPHHPETTEK